MILWFVGLGAALVFTVFNDAALDYRLVALGALAPDLLDRLVGGATAAHTLVGAVGFLALVMVVTVRRRAARRRLLALPIGVFVHLVLDGVWADKTLFWWPAFGMDLHVAVPSAHRSGLVLVAQELVGVGALWWCGRRWGLDDPGRRALLVRTGRLDRTVVGAPNL